MPPAPFAANVQKLLFEATRLRQARRFSAAIEPMRQAAKLQPANAFIWHDLGLTCLEANRVEDAVQALRRAAEVAPAFAEAHWRLGVALELKEDLDGAQQALTRAVELKPSLFGASFRLASILEASGQQALALARFRDIAAKAPPGELRDLARIQAFLLAKEDAKAEQALREAGKAYPKSAAIQGLLGAVLSETGDFGGAEAAFTLALRLTPGSVELYYDLVRCRRIVAADTPLIEAMKRAAGQARTNDEGTIKVELALGKALDDLGDYQAAMAAYDRADALRSRRIRFDLTTFDAAVDWCIAHFSKDRLATLAARGHRDPTPVMVVGMPRSGTTLCEQIIASHPEATGAGELHFWERKGRLLHGGQPPMIGDDAFAQAGSDFIAYLRQIDGSAARIVDKMPTNFLWLGLIHAALPQASLIHCRRNPMDTALSIHQTFFALQRHFPTGGVDLVGYYRGYQRMMEHWRRALPSGRMIEIDYETLVAEPEATSRQIIAHIGLDWDDRCLRPEATTRRVNTPSKWQVRQPIHAKAVHRWRNYQSWLGPLAALRDD